MRQVRRRQLMAALGAACLFMPLPASGQPQRKSHRIGFLYLIRRQSFVGTARHARFLQGMRELGYEEGKNLVIEWRFAEDDNQRLAAMAAELVKLNVDLIVAAASPAIRAAQKATSTIPIVMAVTGDPVASGFALSLARPGGNITGMSIMTGDLSSKYLEFLRAFNPKLASAALLGHPGSSTYPAALKSIHAAAIQLGVNLVRMEVRSAEDIEQGFSKLAREHVEAVVVPPDSLVISHRRLIAQLAAKYGLQSAFGQREYVETGGLISYGPSLAETYRRSASYVDKILKGAKPGDLPIEQPTVFELVVNRNTAKTLGLAIPQELLVRGAELID